MKIIIPRGSSFSSNDIEICIFENFHHLVQICSIIDEKIVIEPDKVLSCDLDYCFYLFTHIITSLLFFLNFVMKNLRYSQIFATVKSHSAWHAILKNIWVRNFFIIDRIVCNDHFQVRIILSDRLYKILNRKLS